LSDGSAPAASRAKPSAPKIAGASETPLEGDRAMPRDMERGRGAV